MSRKHTSTRLTLIERFPWMKKAAIITTAFALTGGATGLSYYAWERSTSIDSSMPVTNVDQAQPGHRTQPKPTSESSQARESKSIKPNFASKPDKKASVDRSKKKKTTAKLTKKTGKKAKSKLSKANKNSKKKLVKKAASKNKKITKNKNKSQKKMVKNHRKSKHVAGH